jgi:transaldolase
LEISSFLLLLMHCLQALLQIALLGSAHCFSASPAKMHLLQLLQESTCVWADTADSSTLIATPTVHDVTTNPSLVYAAAGANTPNFELVKRVIKDCEDSSTHAMAEQLAVSFGVQALRMVPGRVCTQLDIRLGQDRAAMVKQAHRLMELYVAVSQTVLCVLCCNTNVSIILQS